MNRGVGWPVDCGRSGTRPTPCKSGGRGRRDLYTISLLILVGVLVVGFIANLGIGPVDSRFHERASEAKGAAALAIFLWVVVTVALAYGLYTTIVKVADLFSG